MRNAIIFAILLSASAARAEDVQKAEINISNSRNEAVTMRFDYAFRDHTWKLIEHQIDADDMITYRYPSNIPGCEKLREWHITDGVLSISNSAGLLCTERVSLCDKKTMYMDVGMRQCTWH
jgi:hypothetical protein